RLACVAETPFTLIHTTRASAIPIDVSAPHTAKAGPGTSAHPHVVRTMPAIIHGLNHATTNEMVPSVNAAGRSLARERGGVSATSCTSHIARGARNTKPGAASR